MCVGSSILRLPSSAWSDGPTSAINELVAAGLLPASANAFDASSVDGGVHQGLFKLLDVWLGLGNCSWIIHAILETGKDTDTIDEGQSVRLRLANLHFVHSQLAVSSHPTQVSSTRPPRCCSGLSFESPLKLQLYRGLCVIIIIYRTRSRMK